MVLAGLRGTDPFVVGHDVCSTEHAHFFQALQLVVGIHTGLHLVLADLDTCHRSVIEVAVMRFAALVNTTVGGGVDLGEAVQVSVLNIEVPDPSASASPRPVAGCCNPACGAYCSCPEQQQRLPVCGLSASAGAGNSGKHSDLTPTKKKRTN